MTKRSFFKSLMGVVATVALAPEIAFGRALELPKLVCGVLEIKWGTGWCYCETIYRHSSDEVSSVLDASRKRILQIEPGEKSWFIAVGFDP